jgi:hypothetical protein
LVLYLISNFGQTLAQSEFWRSQSEFRIFRKQSIFLGKLQFAILGMISLYVHHDHCEIAVRSLFASPRFLVGLTPYSICTGGIFRSNPGGSSKSDDWNKIKY